MTAPEQNQPPGEEDLLGIYLSEHAVEIAAEEGKQFELTAATADELAPVPAQASAAPVPAAPAAGAQPQPEKEESERLSPIQKIARMTVGERVKLAMLGNKEERSILIRDGSRVVYAAVLASPKLNDAEAEAIAAMKNVQEGVLRELARYRKFMKNYGVVKALVNNPRCPLDISLTFIKNLMTPDLRFLSMNKNVPDTLRKVALKLHKEKTGPPK